MSSSTGPSSPSTAGTNATGVAGRGEAVSELPQRPKKPVAREERETDDADAEADAAGAGGRVEEAAEAVEGAWLARLAVDGLREGRREAAGVAYASRPAGKTVLYILLVVRGREAACVRCGTYLENLEWALGGLVSGAAVWGGMWGGLLVQSVSV